MDDLHGGPDNDTIFGGNDSDAIRGDAGDDFLHGGDGQDFIYGNSGNDMLSGGFTDGDDGDGEYDYLHGNAGVDSFLIGDYSILAGFKYKDIAVDRSSDEPLAKAGGFLDTLWDWISFDFEGSSLGPNHSDRPYDYEEFMPWH